MGRKGSSFEREFCVKLSKWWTHGTRDDIFWRSAGSGARANVRGQRGKRTHGHHGDITATHPSGDPLLDLMTIELKRGYSKHTIADLLDKPKRAAQQKWEEWFEQAYSSAEKAGSYAWLMVQRRDMRQAVVFYPHDLHDQFRREGCFSRLPSITPFFMFDVRINRRRESDIRERIWATTLDNFLTYVSPEDILEIVRRV